MADYDLKIVSYLWGVLSQISQDQILECWRNGTSARRTSIDLKISRSTVRGYYKKFLGTYPNRLEGADLKSADAGHPCGFESRRADFSDIQWKAYCYLLGLYLGDGHIIRSKKTWALRIFQTAKYQHLVRLCLHTMRTCWPTATIWSGPHGSGCTVCIVRSRDLVEAIPQHGPGRKHSRHIDLTGWQRTAIETHPVEFLRGLIHSDGCRSVRKIPNKSTGKVYEYPFYMFSNRSAQILDLCLWVSRMLGLAPTRSSKVALSFTRRDNVRLLDAWIGKKS